MAFREIVLLFPGFIADATSSVRISPGFRFFMVNFLPLTLISTVERPGLPFFSSATAFSHRSTSGRRSCRGFWQLPSREW